MQLIRTLAMLVAVLALGAMAGNLRETLEGKLEAANQWPLGGTVPEEYEESTPA